MTQEKRYYDITNRFVFARVFSNPENAKPLLEAVMGLKIKEIRYVEAEHSIEPSLKGRGVRMDVFVDDADGTVYDVEMQNDDEGDLALRSRYLLSAFNRDRIERREPYANLKRSVVIFICCFDPIGLGRRIYTIRPMVEEAGVRFEDGTLRVFLNAKGASTTREVIGAADSDGGQLAEFLSYVDGGGTMGNKWLERLEGEVRSLNNDEGWRETVLSLESLIEDEKALARKKGMAEGLAEGLELGRSKGLEQGRIEGLEQGRSEGLEQGRSEGLEQGRSEGLEQGRSEGLEQGLEEADELNRRLAQALSEANRGDEFLAAALDPSLKKRLLEEFALLPKTEQ